MKHNAKRASCDGGGGDSLGAGAVSGFLLLLHLSLQMRANEGGHHTLHMENIDARHVETLATRERGDPPLTCEILLRTFSL